VDRVLLTSMRSSAILASNNIPVREVEEIAPQGKPGLT